jgi:hypothetical protein
MPNEDFSNIFSSFTERLRYQFDVFISYSTQQEKEARLLCQNLSSENLKTFFAPISLKQDELTPNQFVNRLEEALFQSCQAVVLLSESFLDSSWCTLEMQGYFGLVHDERNRKLWIVPVEAIDDQLMGQLVPFIYDRGLQELVRDIRRAADNSQISIGDQFSKSELPRMFVELPLREFYEPPTRGNRPPWGKDDRSPHGIPGAPDYHVYERLVREYMVQIMRGREPGYLEIPIQSVAEKYSYMPDEAKLDAQKLINMGVSPYQRPYTRSLGDWLREIKIARAQGQDPAEMECLEGAARANAGQFDEGVRLMRNGLDAGGDNLHHREHYIYEIAKAEHLTNRFEESLEVIKQLAGQLPQNASLVQAASLARLGRLSKEAIEKNRTSKIRINDIRIESEIERREDLDYWAASLKMAGFQL